MNTRNSNGRSQRMSANGARCQAYQGVGSIYPETSLSAGKWLFDLMFKKILLGKVYGWKGNLGWFVFWTTICLGGYNLTGSGWWFGVLGFVSVLKGVVDMHEESADMKERMRERFGDSWERDLPAAGGYGYGGTGSVYDGVGGFGCSPHGFFGWEVPCAAAKADMEMMGFTFGRDE